MLSWLEVAAFILLSAISLLVPSGLYVLAFWTIAFGRIGPFDRGICNASLFSAFELGSLHAGCEDLEFID